MDKQKCEQYLQTKTLAIVVSGPVLTQSGYGVHTRMIVDALMKRPDIDLYLRATRWGETAFLYVDDPRREKYMSSIHKFNESAGRSFDISFQVTIPSEFENMANYNVGVTAGIEVDRITLPWVHKCNEMDQIIVPSEFVKQTIQGVVYKEPQKDGTETPVHVTTVMETIFEGIDTSVFNPDVESAKDLFEFDTDFNFLFVGQWGKGGYGEDRKNITKLVKLFCKAFEGQKDVGLILKVNMYSNHALDKFHTERRLKEALAGARGNSDEFPKVYLIHGSLSESEMAALYTHPTVKAFVSLHHGEGYGLTLAQAAMCDLPVIATNWSASLDFLNKGKWVQLPYELKNIPRSFYWQGVAEPEARWAEVLDKDVVRALRRFRDKPFIPADNAKALGKIMREEFSLEKFLELFDKSFSDLKKRYMMCISEYVIMRMDAEIDKRPAIGYVMPRHAGDVFNSTMVVNALKEKHPDHHIYFFTTKEYMSLLEKNKSIYKVIEYLPQVNDNIAMMRELFDLYFTPHFDVQYTFSNWISEQNPINIVEKFAQHCSVNLDTVRAPGPDNPYITIADEYNTELQGIMDEVGDDYIVLHPADDPRQSARNYQHWSVLAENFTRLGVEVVVVGSNANVVISQDVHSVQDKTSFAELATIIKKAKAFVGIDSLPAHMANHFGVPSVVLFGSSYVFATGPFPRSKSTTCIEPANRHECKGACYKTQCMSSPTNPCINNIAPEDVFSHVQHALDSNSDCTMKLEKTYPLMSGYTTTYNCKKAKIPFEHAINSALMFCNEVVVADGGSDDGTLERLQEMVAEDPRIVLETGKEWDFTEPGIDGEMKSFARMMCTHPILWQFDADEIMHEDDLDQIKDMSYRLQHAQGVSIISLPVVELWGDEKTTTGRRHCWKWRMSKNSPDIIHGIPDEDRAKDEKTGHIYSKGHSDGCFPVNPLTYKIVPDENFYMHNPSIEEARLKSPDAYKNILNQVIKDLPSVWHTSWMDLDNKIDQFRTFWHKQWSLLYQQESNNRFFADKELDYEPTKEEREEVVKSMRESGGEPHDQVRYAFEIAKEPPKHLKDWVEALQQEE